MDAAYSYRLHDANGLRTTEEAGENISYRTGLENLAKYVMKPEWEERYNEEVEISDNGVDNSGALILDDNLVSARQDWLVRIGSKQYEVEVHTHAESFLLTSFKLNKIIWCIKKQGRIVVVRNTYWLNIKPAGAEAMLRKLKPQKFAGFGDKLAFVFSFDLRRDWINQGLIKQYFYKPRAAAVMRNLEARLFPKRGLYAKSV